MIEKGQSPLTPPVVWVHVQIHPSIFTLLHPHPYACGFVQTHPIKEQYYSVDETRNVKSF